MLSAPDGRIAGAAAPGSGARLPDMRSATEERSLSWRRHVYSHGLRAVPMEPSHGQRAGQAPSWQRRIEEWVTRELRALLHSDDVLLLRSFVMGLAASPHALQQEEGPQQALRPFLHDHARHFWHELRCFARVPFSMSTYDRMVEYRPPGTTQEGGTPQAPEAQGSWSLWSARQSTVIDNGDPAGPWHSDRAPSSPTGALQSGGNTGSEEGLGCTDSRCTSRVICVAAGGQGDTGLCLDCAERAAERRTTGGGSRWRPTDSGRVADPAALASRPDRSSRQDEGYSRPQQAGQLVPEGADIIDIADSPARLTAGADADIVINLSSDSEEDISGMLSDAQHSATEHQAALLSAPTGARDQEAPQIQPEPPAVGPETDTIMIPAAVALSTQAADGNSGGSSPVRVSFALPRTRHAARDMGIPFGMRQAPDGACVASQPAAADPDRARPHTQVGDSVSRPSSEPSAAVGASLGRAGREAHGRGDPRKNSCKEDGGGGQRHRRSRMRSRSLSHSRRWGEHLPRRERHSRAYREVERRKHSDQQPGCAENEGSTPACKARWEMWKPGDEVL